MQQPPAPQAPPPPLHPASVPFRFTRLAIRVLPPAVAQIARARLSLFRELGIGLWSFHKTTGKIHRLFTPRHSKPLNARANQKALESLHRFFQFSEFGQ